MPIANENQIKVICAVFNALNHHISFYNRNRIYCCPAICSPIFSIPPGEGREGLGFEVALCFSCKRVLAGHVPMLATRYGAIVVAVSIV